MPATANIRDVTLRERLRSRNGGQPLWQSDRPEVTCGPVQVTAFGRVTVAGESAALSREQIRFVRALAQAAGENVPVSELAVRLGRSERQVHALADTTHAALPTPPGSPGVLGIRYVGARITGYRLASRL